MVWPPYETRWWDRKVRNFFLGALLLLGMGLPAHAFVETVTRAVGTIAKITEHAAALPEGEILTLAQKAAKVGGTKEVGKILGAMRLPEEVLEDTYLRVAIAQSKLSRFEAESIYTRLAGTPGLRSTLSKIVGNSDVKAAGHLNELRIADTAATNGLRVKGIGVAFNDGKKAAPTDIDVLLDKGGREIAIEAKDYAPSTRLPLDGFRADLDSLVEYRSANPSKNVLPVFSLTSKPDDLASLQLLEKEAQRRGVQLIIGSPEEQIIQIVQLLRIT